MSRSKPMVRTTSFFCWRRLLKKLGLIKSKSVADRWRLYKIHCSLCKLAVGAEPLLYECTWFTLGLSLLYEYCFLWYCFFLVCFFFKYFYFLKKFCTLTRRYFILYVMNVSTCIHHWFIFFFLHRNRDDLCDGPLCSYDIERRLDEHFSLVRVGALCSYDMRRSINEHFQFGKSWSRTVALWVYLVLGRVCCFYMNTFFFDSASFWCVVFKKFFRFKNLVYGKGIFFYSYLTTSITPWNLVFLILVLFLNQQLNLLFSLNKVFFERRLKLTQGLSIEKGVG